MTRYVSGCGVRCNIDEPETIQEKLMWLNIYDADPLKSDCADKLKVKEYAKRILGEDISVPTLKVWDSADEINFVELPEKFVLKCNHGSGMNIIVKDKSQINEDSVGQQLSRWLSDDFAFRNGFESHYHWIERKVFAEEYLSIPETQDVPDYKFICLNGQPVYMQIISERFNSGRRMRYYDMNLNRLSLYRRDFSTGSNDITDIFPSQFEKMKKYAAMLSKDFKFVRVDFYEVSGRIYLGELTFTPGAFIFKYGNPEDEIKVGSLLKI